ncbi:putative phage coiled coil domain-containing protein [Rhodanobacter fulvus Jip2]|uniref:Putative phage coiled coil domain-containing protein n=2 Tax=Rhodanobacter TaxID=75309 RepID=I4VMY2_9GAMM|nr:putative phage coiled coil domain-containing protein [Rhodanobacter fulvus Jip2]
MNTQNLATLAPEARAAQLLSFDETKAELTALAKSSERITQISNKAGREECHSSLMLLKSRRIDIEKRGKEARDDANKFAKAVIAKEKELIGFIAPEEERLQILRDQWDTAIEAARLEKLEAERLRVEAIQKKIQAIRDVPASLVGKPSVIIAGQLANLKATVLDEAELGADYLTATDALAAAVARVQDLLAAQKEAEAEQAKIKAEREELERVRAENERLQREAAERAAADRAEADRKAQAERDRVAAEEAAARAAEQAEQERLAAIERGKAMEAAAAERDRLAVERREQEAEMQAERERQAAEQRKLDEQAAQLKREREAAAAKAEADRLANLGLREAAEAVVSARSNGGNVDAAIDDLAAALANDEAAVTPARAKRVARA